MWRIILLSPFTFLYAAIVAFRNYMFTIGMRPSVEFDIPVISVGNLTAGGAGKTPHIEYLIRLLRNKVKIGVLSRGYGRKTSGFILASESNLPTAIGDEPAQIHRKFGDDVMVAVGEERVLAIPSMLSEQPELQAILLDDAYQHRKVKPKLNILLSDFNRPFYTDWPLPSGMLREARSGASRADAIVVSKCPTNLSDVDKRKITQNINKYNSRAPIFFSGLRYSIPEPFAEQLPPLNEGGPIVLLTGIAHTLPLVDFVSSRYKVVAHIEKADHYAYPPSFLQQFKVEWESKFLGVPVLTTEKDAVKLLSEENQSILKDIPFYYLPIEVFFLEGSAGFDNLVMEFLKE